MGGWRESGSAVWATLFLNMKQEDRADKAKDLQLLTPDFPELKSHRVVYCESGDASSSELISGQDVFTAICAQATDNEAAHGITRYRFRPCPGLGAFFSRVGTRIKRYSAQRRTRSFAEVVREGRKETTSQGSAMANQPPTGS